MSNNDDQNNDDQNNDDQNNDFNDKLSDVLTIMKEPK